MFTCHSMSERNTQIIHGAATDKII
jgi:hypothetical protein